MQYRKFGKLGFDVSAFGLGCMRFPLKEQPDGSRDYSQIDEEEAIRMIRYAVDHGVNYLDTAYPYHGGNSERVVGKALKDGYREKVKLATKCPVWMVNGPDDFEKLLDEQLGKLEVDYVDFYLLHALNKESWKKVLEYDGLSFLDRAKQSGKIKYAAFSFHDELPVFKEIIDSYPWDMCQIQLNILDDEYQAGVEGLRYAHSKGISVVIMEPLKGGKLAQHVPNDIQAAWDKAPVKRSPQEWAFRWLANFPEVTVILSGSSTMDQLKDSIQIFETAAPNSLTEEELSIIQEVKNLYKSKIKVDCTACNYCMPCPSGLNIPRKFQLYNDSAMYEVFEEYANHYQRFIQEGKDASHCVECGQCEAACPQSLPIIEKLKELHAYFTR